MSQGEVRGRIAAVKKGDRQIDNGGVQQVNLLTFHIREGARSKLAGWSPCPWKWESGEQGPSRHGKCLRVFV